METVEVAALVLKAILPSLLMAAQQAHGIALALMVRHHRRSDRRRIRILIHAQHYSELSPEVLDSAPGTIHRRPSSGTELCRLFQREFGMPRTERGFEHPITPPAH